MTKQLVNKGLDMGSRSKMMATGLLVAAFITGGVVGGAVSSAWGEGWAQGDNAAQERLPRNDDSGRRRSYGDWLQQELQLTVPQRDSIGAILERRRAEIRRLWQDVGPRFDTLRQDIRDQILGALDEEQQERYQALLAEHDQRRHQRNGKGGGGEARRDK